MNSVTSELCFVNGSPPSQVRQNKTFLHTSIYLHCAVGLFVWRCIFTEPMEEDILQAVKYCTELVEDKDLEKLYLVIKCMKRYSSEFFLANSYNKHKYIINLNSSNNTLLFKSLKSKMIFVCVCVCLLLLCYCFYFK